MKYFLLGIMFIFVVAFLMTFPCGTKAASVQDELAVLQDELYAAIQSTDPNSVEKFASISESIARREDFIRKAGDRYILVNKRDQTLRVVEKEKEVLFQRAIIGRDEQPTPELESKVVQVVMNPDWTVSQNTALLVIAPRFAKDPNYATAMGYVIYSGWGNSVRRLDPRKIDWQKHIDSGKIPYRIYQKPGRFNSLGNIKFVVPNTGGIFIHGTPFKQLFEEENRKFSSGCIRISDTTKLADILLSQMTDKSIESVLKSKRTRGYRVKMPMPLYVVDWPVTVDNESKVAYR